MTRRLYLQVALAGAATLASGCSGMLLPAATTMGATKRDVMAALLLANGYWQATNKPTQWAFWDVAATIAGTWKPMR